MKPALRSLRQRPRARLWLVVAIALASAWAATTLHLGSSPFLAAGGLDTLSEFLGRAITPAIDYERAPPPGTAPLLWKALAAAGNTLVFAGAAMSLALAVGLPLGLLASSAWWVEAGSGRKGRLNRLLAVVAPAVYAGTRIVIAMMRSIHELLWAVLLLAGFGLNDLSAIVAIAIPYSGTLAKVFSELIDEAPRECARALRAAGAGPVQVFVFGLLPIAAPDIGAYSFYRFECALRSSAVLGFFGFPTLGYYIAASFENLHYAEVWTYLYVLVALVIVFDWWSGAVRRRLT